jgi:hypothetical protein
MSKARAIAAANDAEGVSVVLPDNPTNASTGKVVIGRFDRATQTFTATLTSPNAVKVVACRTSGQNGALPLIFGPIFNASTSDVQRQAIAMIGGGTGAGLIALNKTQKDALKINGTVTLTVNNGTIVVDSSDPLAMESVGNPTIVTPNINVVGNAGLSSNTTFTGQINPGSAVVPDPLASLTAPNYASMTNYGTVSVTGNSTTSVNLQPGYYPGGISMTNNKGTLNLAPGIYVVDGTGLKITGGNMYAYGVMFYVMGTGVVDLEGNGTINITGIDPDTYTYSSDVSVYEGVTIFQNSASNTNKTVSKLVGTNTMNLGGTLYFRNNEIDISGTSAGVGNQLIADTINISGNGQITINYDGRNPAAGNRVFIVQ